MVTEIGYTFLPDGELLLLMLNEERKLNLFQLKGASGFVRVDEVATHDASHFSVLNFFDEGSGLQSGHYLSLTKEENCDPIHNAYNLPCTFETTIVKAKIAGKQLSTIRFA